MRTDRQILEALVTAIIEHERNRDEEWRFVEKYGYDYTYWSAEQETMHDEIVADVATSHNKVKALIREAAGDELARKF